MTLKSHPHKLLKNHLKNIAIKSRNIILNKDLNLSLLTKHELGDIAYLIGIAHDFGKATSSFQNFIKKLEKDPNSRDSHENHAPVSSVFCYFLLKKYCKNCMSSSSKTKILDVIPWVGGLCVRKHHGNLFSLYNSYKFDKSSGELYEVRNQISELKKNRELKEIYQDLLSGFNIESNSLFQDLTLLISGENNDFDFEENFDTYSLKKIVTNLKEDERIELFLLVEFLFSLLIDLDKKEAASILKQEIKPMKLNHKIVNSYIEVMKRKNSEFNPSKPLNKLKNKFYEVVVNNKSLLRQNKIYTITAPTGIGKTLTSFAASLRLREILGEKYKLFYILPFTTIIDQNYKIFEKLLSLNFDSHFENIKSDIIIKHHYLSDINLNNEENSKNEDIISRNYLDELLIIKSWDSNIVVSTYIQLLMSIIGFKNSFMNKLHNIINSIIILDEVQFIGVEYWTIIKKVFHILSKRFNTYFLLMTATQPLIFEKDKCVELSNPDFFRDPQNLKVEEVYEPAEITLEQFKKSFRKDILLNHWNRIVVILNTRRLAREFFNFVDQEFKGYKKYHLSTNLVVKHRREIIDEISRLQRDKDARYIVVTTQIIEAGVDMTSDVVYRDLAPYDNILQSAGRCNRFKEIEKGIVNIIHLVDHNRRSYFNYIYDPQCVKITKEEILTCRNMDQQMKIEKYYSLVRNYKHKNSLLKAIQDLDFENVGRNFKLIKDEYPTRLVYICFEDEPESQTLLNEYKERIQNSDLDTFKKLGQLKKLKTKMHLFQVEISEHDFNFLSQNGIIFSIGKFFYIPSKNVHLVYNKNIGFYYDKDELKKNLVDSSII